jgi:4-amino-4-deoxy-L-arabinose transferase-like glycosyltransferase
VAGLSDLAGPPGNIIVSRLNLTRLLNIGTVLVLFVVLGVAYSLATPIFEKPDEMWHLAYIKRLVDGQGYPDAPGSISDDAPSQESSQPPLYYTLAALLVRSFAPDTSDLHTRLTHNPAFPFEAREAQNDNKNVFVHTVIDTFPFAGTARAVQLARLVALCFGALTVYATYRLALEIFPDRRPLAVLAAAFVAFLPQFIFISSAASNDSTAAAWCAVALWFTVRVMRQGFSLRRVVVLGLALGLAALSKVSALGLWPLALLAVAVFRTEQQPKFLTRVGWALLAALMAFGFTGPWFLRSAVVFGDALGTSTHLAMPWARAEALPLSVALNQVPGALNSWWLAFGWGNIIAPAWIYWVLDVLLVFGLIGAIYWMFAARDRRLERWGLLILLAWLVIIVVAFVRWIQLLDAALGRLLFPAISAAAVLIVAGWYAFMRRFAVLPILGMLTLSIVALPLWLTPAYARPALLSQADLTRQPGQAIDVRYGDVARLVRIDWPRKPWPLPGEEPTLRLCWEPLQQDARPLMVLTQIVGAENHVVATRRTLPGLGSYPTSVWQPHAIFCDAVRLPLPADAPAPAVYQVEVGLIDAHTHERLAAFAPDGSLLDTDFMGPLKIAAPGFVEPSIEHALNHKLDDQFELLGYDLDRSTVTPGEAIKLRLYWKALRRPDADYTVFAQMRDAENHIVAQKDDQPQVGAYPTSFWDAGEVVIDDRMIEIPTNAPAGKFPLKIGLYRPADGARLMIDGDPAVNEITLPIEVEVQ